MHTVFKKLTSLVLVAFMVLSMVPIFAVTANAATGGTYQLVTDASKLAVGDKIIIVAKDSNYALSTTQNKNNRGQASITKSTDTKTNDTITTPSAAVQIITLEEGTTTGTFAFNVGTGYLYAASSSSNNLKTQTENDANGSWKIETTADGVATVKAQGSNSRNLLKYNSTSKIFSCYGSGQQDIVLYKLEKTSTPEPSQPESSEPIACEHTNTIEVAEVPATCTTPGTTAGVKCSACGTVISGCAALPAPGHTEVIDEAKAATCTATGLTEGKHCSVCGETIVKQTVVPMAAHNYENGECTVCHAAEPSSKTYIFNQYPNGSSQAQNEEHVLDTVVTMTTNVAYFTTELRLYNTTVTNTKNSYAIINSQKAIDSITINAKGNKNTVGKLNVRGSKDNGENWTLIQAVSITSTSSYNDYTVDFGDASYTYLKFDAEGDQIKLYSMTLKFATSSGSACGHNNTEIRDGVPATCTEPGYTAGEYCYDCETYISGHEKIDALGHLLGEGVVKTPATCTTKGVMTYTCTREGCNYTKTEDIEPTVHNYGDGDTCTVCGNKKAQRYYIATVRSTGNYFYMTNKLDSKSDRYLAEDSSLTTLPEKITAPKADKVFVLVDNGEGIYSIYAEGLAGNNYLGWKSGNSGTFVAEGDAKKLTKVGNPDGTFSFYFANGAEKRYLSLNEATGNDYFAWYTGSQKQDLVLIPVVESVKEWNLTLKDNVGANFKLDVNETDTVHIKVGGKTVTYNASDLEQAGGTYLATVKLAAAQMTEKIEIQVEGSDVVRTYTIREYADKILNGAYTDETKQLVRDMLNYGGMAQKFFGYNADEANLANNGITDVGTAEVPASGSIPMMGTNGSVTGMNYYGATLVFRDKIAVRFYFEPAVDGEEFDIKNYTFAASVKGTPVSASDPVKSGSKYYIEIANINPDKLAEQIEVEVMDNDPNDPKILTVTYGPMNYITRMYSKANVEAPTTEQQNIKNLLKALYNYHLAAKTYVEANQA